jgi:hypothetical protein
VNESDASVRWHAVVAGDARLHRLETWPFSGSFSFDSIVFFVDCYSIFDFYSSSFNVDDR